MREESGRLATHSAWSSTGTRRFAWRRERSRARWNTVAERGKGDPIARRRIFDLSMFDGFRPKEKESGPKEHNRHDSWACDACHGRSWTLYDCFLRADWPLGPGGHVGPRLVVVLRRRRQRPHLLPAEQRFHLVLRYGLPFRLAKREPFPAGGPHPPRRPGMERESIASRLATRLLRVRCSTECSSKIAGGTSSKRCGKCRWISSAARCSAMLVTEVDGLLRCSAMTDDGVCLAPRTPAIDKPMQFLMPMALFCRLLGNRGPQSPEIQHSRSIF